MASKSKRKGNGYEAELVADLTDAGFVAKRAWGSNGRSLGEVEAADVVLTVGSRKVIIQAKRRAVVADYIKPTEGVDVVMTRGDYEATLVVMPLKEYLRLLKKDV
jgi:Holliday junction resolvase